MNSPFPALIDWYDLFKALHIISLITWMAAIFYLPRLFVYHADTAVGSEQSETFKIMERRLLRAIMNPGMVATWIFAALMLLAQPDWLTQGWMHAKLLCVVILTGYHHVLGRWRKDFEADRNSRSNRFYRMANEIPTLLMIVIVLMVVLKPF